MRAASGRSSPDEVIGVAGAVEVLVMVPDHADDDRRQLDSLEDRAGDQRVRRMAAHSSSSSGPGLDQHRVGDADLADVVEQGPVLDLATGRVVQPERAGDANRVLRDA